VRLKIDRTRGRRILSVRLLRNGKPGGDQTAEAERSADAERV
jgi:hypothetical protein